MRQVGLACIAFACCAPLVAAQGAVEQGQEKPRTIRSIRYEEFQGITVDEILRRLEEKGVNLRVETAFDQQKVDQAKEVLTNMLVERGHRNARVRVDVGTIPPRAIGITFTAEEP